MPEPGRSGLHLDEARRSRRVALPVARDLLPRRRLDPEVALDPRLPELVGDHPARDRGRRARPGQRAPVGAGTPAEAVADDRPLSRLQLLRPHLHRALQDEPSEQRRVRDLAIPRHVRDARELAASEQPPRRLALRSAGQDQLTLGQRCVEPATGHLRPCTEAVVSRPEVHAGRRRLVGIAIGRRPLAPPPGPDRGQRDLAADLLDREHLPLDRVEPGARGLQVLAAALARVRVKSEEDPDLRHGDPDRRQIGDSLAEGIAQRP